MHFQHILLMIKGRYQQAKREGGDDGAHRGDEWFIDYTTNHFSVTHSGYCFRHLQPCRFSPLLFAVTGHKKAPGCRKGLFMASEGSAPLPGLETVGVGILLVRLMGLALDARPIVLIEGREAGIPLHRQIDAGQIEPVGPWQ